MGLGLTPKVPHITFVPFVNALVQIERGEMHLETFSKAIEVYTRQITSELPDVKIG
jgi:hypothetical protein